MRFRIHFAAVVTGLALCGAAFAQTKPETAVRKLRNIAAADAVVELKTLIEKQKLPVAVVAEPVSNSVMLAGDAASILKVSDLLATLDKEQPQVLASIVVMDAPVGFAEEVILGESTETNWVLTARETRMLNAGIRLGKQSYGLEILSRPQLSLINNQSGTMSVECAEMDKLNTTITPQFANDGTVKIGVEFQRTIFGQAGEKIQASKQVADGGTMVIRGPRTKDENGKLRETLFIVTIHTMKTPADQPKP